MTPEQETTERSVEHATFTVERTYDASPARAFAAWADPEAKGRWFPVAGDGSDYEFDFEIGGKESGSGDVEGSSFRFEAIYQDIVPDQRIVYSYDMLMGGTRISVSLATVEFKPQGEGTQLIFTEQGAFLDGHDTPAQREQGTGSLLDALADALAQER